jgi:hypothetical protein
MKKLYVGVLAALFLVFALAACKQDVANDPVDPAYQGVYDADSSYAYQYLKLGANSLEYSVTEGSPLTVIEGVSTGGGGSDETGRWDYVYVDGGKCGIVGADSNGNTMVAFGQIATANTIDRFNIVDATASGVSSNAQEFFGTKR